MEMLDKFWTYMLDCTSPFVIYLGVISGSDITVILGSIASLVAIINHGSQWLGRQKAKRKKKN